MNTNHVNGIAVVSIDGGERLGTVSEILLSAQARRVSFLGVGTAGGGMFSGQPTETKWIASKDVRALGSGALMVQDSSCLKVLPKNKESESLDLSQLCHRKVVTEGGTDVGQVESVELDEKNLHVTHVEVSPGFFKSNKMVAIKHVVNVGDDVLIVANEVCAVEPAPAQGESVMPTDDDKRPVTVTTERKES